MWLANKSADKDVQSYMLWNVGLKLQFQPVEAVSVHPDGEEELPAAAVPQLAARLCDRSGHVQHPDGAQETWPSNLHRAHSKQ